MDDTSTLQLPRVRRREALVRRGSGQETRKSSYEENETTSPSEITWTVAAFVGLFLLAWVGSVVIQHL